MSALPDPIDRSKEPFVDEPDLGAAPGPSLDDDLTKDFFLEGERLSRKNENEPSIEDEPDKERGWFKRQIDKLFKMSREEAERERLALGAIAAGAAVGSEGQTANAAEKATAAELGKGLDIVENKTNVLALKGDRETQLNELEALRKKLLPDINPYDKKAVKAVSEGADANLYKKLLKRGPERMKADERMRMSEIEGPTITQDLLARMSDGEIPWTVNGIYKAMNMLQADRSPQTGERLEREANNVFDIKTGKLLKAAAVATGAAAFAGEVFGRKKNDGSKERPLTEELHEKSEATEARRFTELMAEEYREQLERTRAEYKKISDELQTIDDDTQILSEIRFNELPRQQMIDALAKNLPLMAEYAKRFARLDTDDDAESERIGKMSDDDFIAEKIGAEPLVGDSDEYENTLRAMLTDATRQLRAERDHAVRRLSEMRTEIAQLERGLLKYDPEAVPASALDARSEELAAEIEKIAKRLKATKDLSGREAAELASQLHYKRAELAELADVIDKIKNPPSKIEIPAPEAEFAKTKKECGARIKRIIDRLSDCRREIDKLRDLPETPDNIAKLIELKLEAFDLEEQKAVEYAFVKQLIADQKQLLSDAEPYAEIEISSPVDLAAKKANDLAEAKAYIEKLQPASKKDDVAPRPPDAKKDKPPDEGAERTAIRIKAQKIIKDRVAELEKMSVEDLEATAKMIRTAGKNETYEKMVEGGYLMPDEVKKLLAEKDNYGIRSLSHELATAYERAAAKKSETNSVERHELKPAEILKQAKENAELLIVATKDKPDPDTIAEILKEIEKKPEAWPSALRNSLDAGDDLIAKISKTKIRKINQRLIDELTLLASK